MTLDIELFIIYKIYKIYFKYEFKIGFLSEHIHVFNSS